MKIIYALLAILTLTLSSFSADQLQGESGTLKMTWNEFQSMNRDCNGISLKKGFNNTEKDSDWTKIEVRFDVTNKSSERKKVRYLISIFDKSQNLIFSGSGDNGIGGLETEEMKCKAKISSKISFDPGTVYIRCWWMAE